MQFATLTMEQSKILFGNRKLKKADMDRSQVKALMALEAVEQYKLSIIEENKLGYQGCKGSMIETANMIEAVRQNAIAGGKAMRLPFYPEGKKKWRIAEIARVLGVEELDVIDAIRIERPDLLRKGINHKFRELEAYEFRKFIMFRKRLHLLRQGMSA